MTSQTLSTGPAPRIVIEEVKGDLSIVGWGAQELLVKADDENVRIRQDGQTVYFSCSDDLTLRMPRGGSLEVQTVAGDMSLRGITGSVEIKAVKGDLSIRDIGSALIESVDDDFDLRGASGDLRIKNINADASIRDVAGGVTIELVSDDLVVRGVGGNLKATVGADAVVYLDPKAGHEYSVNAGEDILAILPSNANATLNLTADEVEIQLPDIPREDSSSRVVTLGDGSAKISLSAGGGLRVSGRDTAAESADEFGNLAGAMFDWNDFGRELGGQISQRVSEATRQAERKMREAEKKIRRIDSRMRTRGPIPPRPASFQNSSPRPDASAKDQPVTDEERMAILKMLQEKKITAEEADKLLSALEGGE
jgi:hypothetical protein